jgi:hypothetical protein
VHSKSSTFVYKQEIDMKNVHSSFKALCVVVLSMMFASLAHAQASRTWVSGVGDDANSCTRLAPCKTFARAFNQTAIGGEIDAIDAGENGTLNNGAPGPLVISKSITIDGTQGGGFASIMLDTASTGPAIAITAAKTDVVTIRNVSINGKAGTGDNGIVINSAGTVHIENCVVSGTIGSGISDVRTGSANDVFYLYIKDTIVRNGRARGIWITPQTSGVFVIASLTNVRSQDNADNGVELTSGTYATLDHCTITGNRRDGVFVRGNPAGGGTEGTASAASAHIDSTNSSNNGSATGAGFHAGNGGFIRLSTSTAYDNTTGLQIDGGGSIRSYGNNRISGNTNGNGPPSGMIALQ